jgi:hypothetical protein
MPNTIDETAKRPAQAKMIRCNEAVVIQLSKMAAALTESGDQLPFEKACGAFNRIAPAEQVAMVWESLSVRMTKLMDDVQDLKQCSRAEAAEWVTRLAMGYAAAESNR